MAFFISFSKTRCMGMLSYKAAVRMARNRNGFSLRKASGVVCDGITTNGQKGTRFARYSSKSNEAASIVSKPLSMISVGLRRGLPGVPSVTLPSLFKSLSLEFQSKNVPLVMFLPVLRPASVPTSDQLWLQAYQSFLRVLDTVISTNGMID
jgi:hypothetical protein